MKATFEAFSLPAPAKINLFLHIIGRRADGYHELESALQFLDFADNLNFSPLDHGEESQLIAPELCGAPKQNLIWRALIALKPFAKKKIPIRIELEKNIPLGGGLGGGSSDAATTLIALNYLWECALSQTDLRAIALELGADVPFFVGAKAAFVSGIGEKLSSSSFKEQHLLLVCPNCHSDTKAMYAHPQLTRDTPAGTIGALELGQAHNDFETLARTLYPEVEKAFLCLDSFGIGKAKLSGSGSCIFLSFNNLAEANAAKASLAGVLKSKVVSTKNSSPLLEAAKKMGMLFPDWGVAKW